MEPPGIWVCGSGYAYGTVPMRVHCRRLRGGTLSLKGRGGPPLCAACRYCARARQSLGDSPGAQRGAFACWRLVGVALCPCSRPGLCSVRFGQGRDECRQEASGCRCHDLRVRERGNQGSSPGGNQGSPLAAGDCLPTASMLPRAYDYSVYANEVCDAVRNWLGNVHCSLLRGPGAWCRLVQQGTPLVLLLKWLSLVL